MAFEDREDKEDGEKQEKELRKVQIVAKSYYARKDVQNAIFEFCKHRETVPRYLDGFGKRPDMFDYPNDIFNYAKKGATSFHCSEELWGNPLDINTDMNADEYNKIKIGWDFLIDIDSKYLDYSKIAAKLIIQALEHNGVKNIGLKFSGSKGFHLIVPFKAFPKQVGDELTKDHFPEWARLIAQYVDEMVQRPLTEKILGLTNQEELEKKGKLISEVIFKLTNQPALIHRVTKFRCPNFKCRTEMNSTTKSKRKTLRCPSCNGNMEKISEEEYYLSQDSKYNSQKNPEFFEERKTAKAVIDSVDIILVASRHLFRAPYSLHEKTALASVVVDKKKIDDFNPMDADPLKVKPVSFMPDSEEGEARELLMNALDWAKRENIETIKKYEGKAVDLKGLTIDESMFPDVIKKIMKGMKSDGRKRALGILLSFLTSLEFPQDYIEEKVNEWNKKNYKPLKTGYVKSQVIWALKNKRMPQNYDKPIYKDLGFPVDAQGVKNPINYTIKEAFRAKGRSQGKERSQGKKAFEI